MTCLVGNCGEWWAKDALAPLLDWREVEGAEPDVLSLIGEPWPPAPCPICRREMVVSVRARVVFDHCDKHGVWLDRRERAMFDAAFGIWRRLFDGDRKQ